MCLERRLRGAGEPQRGQVHYGRVDLVLLRPHHEDGIHRETFRLRDRDVPGKGACNALSSLVLVEYVAWRVVLKLNLGRVPARMDVSMYMRIRIRTYLHVLACMYVFIYVFVHLLFCYIYFYFIISFADGAAVFVPERQGHVRRDLPQSG